MIYKLPLIALITMLSTQCILANAAQPGLWTAGGTGTFSLLFQQDTVYHDKIQMVDELISIKLFDGFAVVKGSYWMYNAEDYPVTIHAGYPVNSIFESQKDHYHVTNVRFDSLYEMKVLTDGIPTPFLQRARPGAYGSENWRVWETNFPPQDTTLIQVYFMVNTSESLLKKGYSSERLNGFIYLLESGSTWKQPITKGKIQIQLSDDVALSSIRGISPDSIFGWNEPHRLLSTTFRDLSPTPENNIVITYQQTDHDISYHQALAQAAHYFEELDSLEQFETDRWAYEHIRFDSPYETGFYADSIGWYLFYFISGVVTLIIIPTGLIIFFFVRRTRHR